MGLLGCQNVSTFTDETSTNDPEVVRADIEDKLSFYIDKLIEIGGVESEVLEVEANTRSTSETTDLSTGYTEYNREDLPEQIAPVFPGNGIDPEFIIITIDTLNEFAQVLDECETIIENEYLSINVDHLEYTMKIRTTGYQLYIESYRIFEEEYDSIGVDIMFFDLIDENIIFKIVRDYQNSEEHNLYYDEFSETGNIINIALDVEHSMFAEYQIYDRERNIIFSLSNTFMGGQHLNYGAGDGSYSFGIGFDEYGVISRYSMRYGSFPQIFWYVKDNDQIYLTWNLYLTQGWNRCRVYSSGYDYVFIDDTLLLQDFNISISVEDKYANARLTVSETEFTKTLMDLTDYGLLFDEITFDELNADIDYIEQNFISIIEIYGLSLDMEANYGFLYDIFPYTANESIVQRIRNWLKNILLNS